MLGAAFELSFLYPLVRKVVFIIVLLLPVFVGISVVTYVLSFTGAISIEVRPAN